LKPLSEIGLTFFVAGAARSGTTSLHRYLAQHPDVFLPPNKPRFLVLMEDSWGWKGPGDAGLLQNSTKSVSAYASLYATRQNERAVGDVSTPYLYNVSTAVRLREAFPTAKVVVLLRNPADRAYSAFQIQRRRGLEPLADFEAALDAEAERIEAGWSYAWHYRSMGFYGEQLQRYYDVFPREQILVATHDELRTNALSLTQTCYRFLDVDDMFAPDTSVVHNPSGVSRIPFVDRALLQPTRLRQLVRRVVPRRIRRRAGRSEALSSVMNKNLHKPELPGASRRKLLDSYQKDIERLQLLTGLDLTDWYS
jgi:hypothetical protein